METPFRIRLGTLSLIVPLLAAVCFGCGLKKYDARTPIAKRPQEKQSLDVGAAPAVITATKPVAVPAALLACSGLLPDDALDEEIPQADVEDLCASLALIKFKENPENDQGEPFDFGN